MTTIYCMSCKEKVKPVGLTKATTTKGQPMLRGTCPECERKLAVFVKRGEAAPAAKSAPKKKVAPKAKQEEEKLPMPKLVRAKAKPKLKKPLKKVTEDSDDEQ